MKQGIKQYSVIKRLPFFWMKTKSKFFSRDWSVISCELNKPLIKKEHPCKAILKSYSPCNY